MLRVAIDATPLLHQPTGVGLFTRCLIDELQHHPVDLRPYAITRRARTELAPLLPDNIRAYPSQFPARFVHKLWPRVDFPKVEIWTGPVDVAHGTNFVAPPTSGASIVTVHDLTMILYPEWVHGASLGFPALIRRSIDRGAVLQCFTHHVAAELADAFGVAADRIAVIAPGVMPVPEASATRAREQLNVGRYIWALGTVEPRKNLPNLLRAFDVVTDTDTETHLVIVGADGWGVEEFNTTLENMRSADRVHRIGYASDEARGELLRGASVLAYPSWYEGFGHPPLEAMSVGVPVMASSAAPMPEVLGDAAEFAAPDDVAGMASALRVTLDDETRRAELIAAGSAQVARYSWLRTGSAFVELYQRVSEEHS
ncbi:MAG: glycosyltransferase family 1 protein [Acidimicrobiia bacterium]